MDTNTPSLRADLEFIPIQEGERKLIAVRDHLGLVPEGTAIPAEGFGLVAMLDGQKTREKLLEELHEYSGDTRFSMKQLLDIIDQLDSVYLLHSERFAQAWQAIVQEFSASDLRPASLSGRAYPEHPEELEPFIDEVMAKAPAGAPFGKAAALVAPHIDPALAGPAYAAAYVNLAGAAPARVVVLGVGHSMPQGLFCTTTKAFETPLGVVQNDEFASLALSRAGAGAMAVNDFAHRSEHSIEFQLLFLQRLLGSANFTVVPVLCGSPSLNLPAYTRQAFLDKAGGFLEALEEMLEDEETLLLAGVDLSHVGPKFGHQQRAVDMEEETRAHDQALLEALAARDAGAFWAESARVEDMYNVCGFSALATLLEVLPVGPAKVLDYQFWREEPTNSAVSYATAVFARE